VTLLVDTLDYVIMYNEGGVSLDTDFWLEKDISELVSKYEGVILGTWSE
jgi:mannosyltransferase OCH1-like enzyme